MAENRSRSPGRARAPERETPRPGGKADVIAGMQGDHWQMPRDYGLQAAAAGQTGARDRPLDTPRGEDPTVRSTPRNDVPQVPPVALQDYGQLIGGQGTSGWGRAAQQMRGPKGYRRSDERIADDLYRRLSQDDAIDSSDVTFEVRDGVVVLEGTVAERRSRYSIEDAAAACQGVVDVENRIRVARGRG